MTNRLFLVSHRGQDQINLDFFVTAPDATKALEIWLKKEMVEDLHDPQEVVQVHEVPALAAEPGVMSWPSPLIERILGEKA